MIRLQNSIFIASWGNVGLVKGRTKLGRKIIYEVNFVETVAFDGILESVAVYIFFVHHIQLSSYETTAWPVYVWKWLLFKLV